MNLFEISETASEKDTDNSSPRKCLGSLKLISAELETIPYSFFHFFYKLLGLPEFA